MSAPRREFTFPIMVFAICIPAAIVLGQSVNSGQVQSEPPTRPRDPAHELALKINGSFTLAAVGDVMIRRPASNLDDLQSALQVIRGADIGFGNLEGNLADIPHFTGPLRGMMGSKDVAADL